MLSNFDKPLKISELDSEYRQENKNLRLKGHKVLKVQDLFDRFFTFY